MNGEHFCVNCGAKLSYVRGDIWKCDYCEDSFNLNNLRREQEHAVLDYLSSIKKVIKLFNRGKELIACDILQKMTDEFYDREEVWLYLGQIYLLFDRPDMAMNAFNEVLRLGNTTKEVYFHIALLYECNEQYDKAIEAIEMGLSLYNEPINNYYFDDNENNENVICSKYFKKKTLFYDYYGWYFERDNICEPERYDGFNYFFNGTYEEIYIHCILLAVKNDDLNLANKYIKYAIKKDWITEYSFSKICKMRGLRFSKFFGLKKR